MSGTQKELNMLEIQSKSIEMIDISQIIPNPKNANQHPPEQIKRLEKLIEYQGFRNPLIISNRTGFLVVGHGRLEAAKNLGIEKLPVIRQNFKDEAQEYAYLISDNEIARWSELDKQAVHIELETLDIDLNLLAIQDFTKEEDKKKEDKTVDLSFDYKLEVDCKTEEAQQYLLSELEDRDYEVRVLL
jgi:hypothetical protein